MSRVVDQSSDIESSELAIAGVPSSSSNSASRSERGMSCSLMRLGWGQGDEADDIERL